MNPYLTYTKSKKELKNLLLDTNGWYFYNGEMWEIKSKHIGVGVYNVWSVKKKFDNES